MELEIKHIAPYLPYKLKFLMMGDSNSKEPNIDELKAIDTGINMLNFDFGDGWGANVRAEIINGAGATKRRKNSKGFAGYDWMVQSIIFYGEITTETQRKKSQQLETV